MREQHLFGKSSFLRGIGLSILVGGIGSSAFGAGFEKAVMWSGKWSGVAAAAASGVNGPESLFFNPAGLAGREGFQASVNFSPTLGTFNGPIAPGQPNSDTGYHFNPVYGVLASYGITPKWAVGIGSFVSAGTKAVYGSVGNFSSSGTLGAFTASPRAEIYEIDYSIGTAYEVMPGLKVGAAWRISHVQAALGTVYSGTYNAIPSLNEAQLDDLGATTYNGYRVGAQYTSSDQRWGLGVNYRSGINFVAKGNATNRILPGNSTTYVNESLSDVTAATSLPSQLSVGGDFAVTESVRLFLQYDWTNYYHNQEISIVGATASNFATTAQNIGLGFSNENTFRLGVACTALQDWTFRAGYGLATQVTPDTQARATFEAPGIGQVITVGAGTSVMDKTLDLDVAVEHSFVSGDSATAPVPGDFSANAWALHLGATYRM